jgi:RNA polymerase sigma-70 factor (ECF subfamily)
MWLTKVRMAAAVVLAVASLTCGVGVLVHRAMAEEPESANQQPQIVAAEPARAPEAEQGRGGRESDAPTVKSMPPVVVRTFPQAGDTQVDAAAVTEIRVTFSKDMTDKSWSWSQISDESFPKTSGKPHYDQDRRTCILPVKLEPGKTYVLWLNPPKFQGFRDVEGHAAVFYPLVFETKK